MDKLHEESRKQFEEWFLSEMEIDVSEMRNDDPSTSAEWPYTTGADESSLVITVAFKAWQASRASVVVDTPPLCGDGENDTEYTEGYNDGITATENTIRSIGLSIKGE
ncbi:MAG: hypothetical protein ACRDE7_05460 [Sphingobacterium sp.]